MHQTQFRRESNLSGPDGLLLDGEIVAPEPATGVPRFGLLQRRLHAKATAALIRSIPSQFYAFDLLHLGAEDLMPLPYLERRRALLNLELSGGRVVTPPHWQVAASTLLEVARQHEVEGILSKRVDGPYVQGRSKLWIKSPIRRTLDAVVAGSLGRDAEGVFRSLILAGHTEDGRLAFVGCVGSGGTRAVRRLTQTKLERLFRDTSPLDIPPPGNVSAHAHWVEPRLVADVTYREWTGNALRHSAFRGLRTDIDPDDVGLPAGST
ncbi:ATP-dependent DNA ligase (plasmid) [Nocardia sp. NBC_01377]|uniref:ATP dependent DNA ligase n=1 Tax=Nocardia sp. NBC_01377 TaxID=2903595 RepID=UPI002F912536